MKGQGTTSITLNPGQTALWAARELKFLRDKPRNTPRGGFQISREHIDAGHNFDVRYVLMEYGKDGENKQLKFKYMNRLEAWKRNQILRGTGFAWAICGRTT